MFVAFNGEPHSKSVPVVDGTRRLSAVMLYGPVDPTYLEAVWDMGGAILEAGKANKWDKSEKHHKRAGSPSAARGISCGKGQPQLMRLGGKRQPMMEQLMERESLQRVAGFQSGRCSLQT